MATTKEGPPGAPTPALAGELKQLVLELLGRRLDRMFEGADSLLLSMSEKSRNSTDQRRYFDTRHLVRQHRPALTRLFKDELAAGFLPGAEDRKKPATTEVSFDEIRMAQTRTIEESIAVNNIALKAANQNEQALFEINRRLDYLINDRGAAASPQALTPSTLCNAFRIGTQSLNLDLQYELVIYKLFDQLVVSSLNEVYAEALQLLERGGVTPAVLKSTGHTGVRRKIHIPGISRAPAEPSPAQSPATGPQASAPALQGGGQAPDWSATRAFAADLSATGWHAPAPDTGPIPLPGGSLIPAGSPTGAMPALDPRTLGALRSAGGPAAPALAHYGDAELATELSQLASGQAVAGFGLPQARANIQCADLVGRMFNGIVEDAAVAPALKPALDELRFSVIKSALADRTFFSSPDHPIRKLIHELATLAAVARATGTDTRGPLASLVASAQSQFKVEAKAVRAAAASAAPLAEPDAERFLDDQLVQAKARRQALIDRARQVVREVLDLRLKGRTIPAEARPMLLGGVSPLLGLRLLRKGMDSEAWREGVLMLEQTLEALDPAAPAPEAAATAQLCEKIERELLGAGMLAQRTAELLAGLKRGFEAAQRQRESSAPAAAPPAEPAPEAPTALLLRLLVPGDWFKVHDPERQQTRWLKVVAQHLEDERSEYRRRVEFAEFSGQNPLLVKVDELLEHIATGMTEPFDQSPAARATLAELIRQQQARMAAAPDFPS